MMNPTSPMTATPKRQTRVISRTSVNVGLRDNRITRLEFVINPLNLSIHPIIITFLFAIDYEPFELIYLTDVHHSNSISFDSIKLKK